MRKLPVLVLAAVAAASFLTAARAQMTGASALLVAQAPATGSDHGSHHGAEAKPESAGEGYSEAEVRRVDRAAQKVTLRHGPIPNLGMPDMTMVFRVTDPSVLDRLKTGDKVRFKADKVGGQYTVTAIEPVK